VKHFNLTMTRAIVFAALCGTILSFAVFSTVFVIGIERARHATLDAASAAVRANVGNGDTASAARWLDSMTDAFVTWNLTAAAFDSSGRFVGGNARLRGDGLPAGREPAPPAARQIAVVPTRDGYVLLVPSTRAVMRMRVTLALVLLAMLAAMAPIAYFAGSAWVRRRSRGVARLSAHLHAIAAGEHPPQLALDGDPAFGELSNAARAALERLVQELNSRAADEDRLRAFLGEAGHELRTPLAIAVGYVGILKRGALGDPALAERIVGDIAAEHDRLHRLVERILQLARLDALPGEQGATCDAAAVANEAIALVRPLDLQRSFDVDASSPVYAAIPADDLRDALRNLLENAIRYAPGASIAVRIENEGSDVSIRVADRGPGMDAFTAEHAFDRFFRGADRGSVPGSGLGLAIVRRIVERAGGTVVLVSAPGSGTAVDLRVPRTTPS
jgi:two-component system, OmpR family, sensor kinase